MSELERNAQSSKVLKQSMRNHLVGKPRGGLLFLVVTGGAKWRFEMGDDIDASHAICKRAYGARTPDAIES